MAENANAWATVHVEWRQVAPGLESFDLWVDARATGWNVHKEGAQWVTTKIGKYVDRALAPFEVAANTRWDPRWVWFTETAAKEWAIARYKESNHGKR